MKNKNKMTKKIHLWIPNIFQFKGGIQVYCAFLIEAIQQVYPSADYDVFLKHDTHCTANVNFLPETKFHYGGNIPAKLRTFYFALLLLINSLQKRPDIIICGHVNFSPLAAKVSNLLNIPYWVIVHGIDVWNLDDPKKIKGLKSADKIISVSRYTGDRIVKEQNISPEQISLVPNTFDANKLSIQPKPQYLLDRYQFQANQSIILTVARLAEIDRYKGYDKIIQALSEIRRQIPDIHYLLVGKGPDRDRIEKLIQAKHLQDCVTLAGFVPDHELADHYNLCDVFAMPSKGEGFGIVYLEALACGKPTIGGNQDGAIDALRNGELGVLVDPDDLKEISTVIIEILQKTYPLPILYQPETLRKKVIEIYGFEQFKQNLAELLSAHFKEVR
jgi:glycosyltransferase involved in cell wall biosynthesis